MAAKEDVSKHFGEDAGEILQLCDDSGELRPGPIFVLARLQRISHRTPFFI